MKKQASILVVGSINMDLVLRSERAPLAGESFFGSEYLFAPGGKGANQAVAAARLGAAVTFAGKIGHDHYGIELRKGLEQAGINTEHLSVSSTDPSGLAVIILENSGENRILVYPGANMTIEKKQVQQVFENSFDAVIINMEIPLAIIKEVKKEAKKKSIPVVLDAGPATNSDPHVLQGCFIVSPNETETEIYSGLTCSSLPETRIAAVRLFALSEPGFVVLKLGAKGSFIYDGQRFSEIKPYEIDVVDTTAAGDCFTSAMTVKYLETGSIRKSVLFANAAAALSATRLGAQPSMPTAEETLQAA